MGRHVDTQTRSNNRREAGKTSGFVLLIAVGFVALIAFVAMNAH